MLSEGGEPDTRPIVVAVDDQILVPIGWARGLRKDIRIIPAGNAARALHLLSTMERVDLLMTDLHMPGMHGGELLRVAAQCFPHIPRILFTGDADDQTIDTLVGNVEVSDVLYKPLSTDEIGQYVMGAVTLNRRAATNASQLFSSAGFGLTRRSLIPIWGYEGRRGSASIPPSPSLIALARHMQMKGTRQMEPLFNVASAERTDVNRWTATALGAGLLTSAAYVMFTFVGHSQDTSVFLDAVRTLTSDGTLGRIAAGLSLVNTYALWRVLRLLGAMK